MIPAVIYARYSSSNQREESIDGQLRVCHDYADRYGFEIVKEYTDSAISGKTDDRPAFQRMIREAESGVFQAVIVWKLDRFARNRYDAAIYRNKLAKHHVKIYSAMEAISDGPEGIILEGLMESLAEYYSANLAENVRRGLYENALNGKAVGSKIPLGYKRGTDGRYEIDENTAPIVRRIFQEYADGIPLKKIADGLNSDGIRTAAGNPFKYNSFKSILRCEKYIGIFRYKDIITTDTIPPIVDRDTWEKCQKMIQRKIHRPRRQNPETPVQNYLLSTKLFCGHCGSPMVGDSGRSKNGEVYRYYACASVKKADGKCTKKRVPKEWIENQIIHILMDQVLTDEMIEYLADAFIEDQKKRDDQIEIQAFKNQLNDVSRKIQNINKAISEGIWSSTTGDMLRSLEEEKTQLEEKIRDLQIRPADIPRDAVIAYLKDVKDGQTSHLQEKLIDLFIRRIYLRDAEDGGMTALFELNMDGADGDPVSFEIALSVFEKAESEPAESRLIEHAGSTETSVLILVRISAKEKTSENGQKRPNSEVLI